MICCRNKSEKKLKYQILFHQKLFLLQYIADLYFHWSEGHMSRADFVWGDSQAIAAVPLISHFLQ